MADKLNESTKAIELAQSAAADIYELLFGSVDDIAGDPETGDNEHFEDYDTIAKYCQDYFLDESISPSQIAENISSIFGCTPHETDAIYEILDGGIVSEIKESSFKKVNWEKAQNAYLDEHHVDKFIRQQILPETSLKEDHRYKVFYTSNTGSRIGKTMDSRGLAIKFAKMIKEDGCTDVKITRNGKPFGISSIKESVEGTTFPNKIAENPYNPKEAHGKANSNGADDVNHIQKNGAESPKAESAGLKSGIYKPITSYDWSKANSGSLTEMNKKQLFEKILKESIISVEVDWAGSYEEINEFNDEHQDEEIRLKLVSNAEDGHPIVRVEGTENEVKAYLNEYFDNDTEMVDEIMGEADFAIPGGTSLHGEDETEYLDDFNPEEPSDELIAKTHEILRDLFDDGQIDEEELEMMEQAPDGGVEDILMTLGVFGFDTVEDILNY